MSSDSNTLSNLEKTIEYLAPRSWDFANENISANLEPNAKNTSAFEQRVQMGQNRENKRGTKSRDNVLLMRKPGMPYTFKLCLDNRVE